MNRNEAMRKYFFLLLCLTGGVIGRADSEEIKNGERIYAPIRHQKYYRNEQELFGYNPKFAPGVVSFDSDNRPYIIADDDKPIIQTLDDGKKWITLDFGKDIRQCFPSWDGTLQTGAFGSSRITFDSDGDAYYLAATGRSNLGKVLLLHSKDRCRNWDVYELPYREFGRLEVNDTFNLKDCLPSIIFYQIHNRAKGELRLITLQKNAAGKLVLSSPILITQDSLLCHPHSGDGNFCISRGDNIHLVWASNQADGEKGIRHYSATYNRKTGQISPAVLIGRSNEFSPDIDNHCLPVMTIDGNRYLHVILGTHHHPSKYARSLQPDSTAAWTVPETFGVLKKKEREGSYTYPSVNCDSAGNIHVVSRWAGNGYSFSLVYNRRNAADGRWDAQQTLVMPFRSMYGCWYHRVSIDRAGRLFLYYINYLNQLDQKSLEAYNQKWPEDKINLHPAMPGSWDDNIKPHLSAILMTDVKFKWFLCCTSDFIRGIETQK